MNNIGTDLGDIADLETESKNNVVDAVNELNGKIAAKQGESPELKNNYFSEANAKVYEAGNIVMAYFNSFYTFSQASIPADTVIYKFKKRPIANVNVLMKVGSSIYNATLSTDGELKVTQSMSLDAQFTYIYSFCYITND